MTARPQWRSRGALIPGPPSSPGGMQRGRCTSTRAGRMGPTRSAASGGFTLIEILITISIIATMMAIAIPVFGIVRESSKRKSTSQLVQGLANAIATFPRGTTIRLPGGQTRYLWDLNNDGLVDGDPARDANFTVAERTNASAVQYTGPVAMLGVTFPRTHVDRQGRLLDSWGNPLRLRYSAELYGSLGVGVWSIGKDGVDQAGDGDDLSSWAAP